MNRLINLGLLSAAASVSAHGLTAQTLAEIRGNASSFALAVSLDSPDNLASLFKPTGHQEVGILDFPGLPNEGSPPNYHTESLFAGYFALPSSSGSFAINVDAQSSGNDVIPIDAATAIIDPNNELWGAFYFAVGDPAVPGSANGVVGGTVNTVAIKPGNEMSAASNLFGFYFPGSEGIGDALIGGTFLEQTEFEMGIAASQGWGSRMDALDIGMPVVSQNAGQPDGVFINNPSHEYYFSLTEASAELMAAWLTSHPSTSSVPLDVAESGATIWQTTWTGTSWDHPIVFRTPTGLLGSSAISPNDEEVDAIAIDVAIMGSTDTVLFSTDVVAGREQVLLDMGGSAPPEPVRIVDPSGGPLPTDIRTGIEILPDDDLEAFCVTDPESLVYSGILGTVVLANPGQTASLSLTRGRVLGSADWEVVAVVSTTDAISNAASTLTLEIVLASESNPTPVLIQTPWMPSTNSPGMTLRIPVGPPPTLIPGFPSGGKKFVHQLLEASVNVKAKLTTGGLLHAVSWTNGIRL